VEVISHEHEASDLHSGDLLPLQHHGHEDSTIFIAVNDEALMRCALNDVVRDAWYDGS
jgi:hypothetical protein